MVLATLIIFYFSASAHLPWDKIKQKMPKEAFILQFYFMLDVQAA